jgi:inosine/xanthosine triphosphatase
MKTIVLASKNPVKIQATLGGFRSLFPDEEFQVVGVIVPSGVSDQPMTDEETLQGARNRTVGAAQSQPQADYWIGIEGGVEEFAGEMVAFAWIVVSDGVREGKSRTGTFTLPHPITELIHQGIELGKADDILFQRSNSKQMNGAIGILTNDVIDRTELYQPSVVMALVPFLNPELYSPHFSGDLSRPSASASGPD